MKKILAVIPVRNRVNTTLAFLKSLNDLKIPKNVDPSFLIIDDGSSDGTKERVKAAFPNVEIYAGDGSLYWSGAVQLGIGIAIERNYDYIWLLNDDSILDQNCLNCLVEVEARLPGRIYTGNIVSSDGKILYGGLIRRPLFRFRGLSWEDFSDGVAKVDAVNGNCLLVSCSLIQRMALPDLGIYIHEGFDLFLGLEASRLGRRPIAVQDAVAVGAENNEKFSFYFNDTPIRERVSGIIGPKGVPPKMYWNLCSRFAGLLGVFIFLRPYLRVLLPHRREI